MLERVKKEALLTSDEVRAYLEGYIIDPKGYSAQELWERIGACIAHLLQAQLDKALDTKVYQDANGNPVTIKDLIERGLLWQIIKNPLSFYHCQVSVEWNL